MGVFDSRDQLGELSAYRPSGSRYRGGTSATYRLFCRTRELWPLANEGNDKRRKPRGRIPMLRVSARATDSSVEASVMEVERCGGVVWSMTWINSRGRTWSMEKPKRARSRKADTAKSIKPRYPRTSSPCQCPTSHRRFGSLLLVAEEGHLQNPLHSKHAQALHPPLRRGPATSRRTVHDVGVPLLIRSLGPEVVFTARDR